MKNNVIPFSTNIYKIMNLNLHLNKITKIQEILPVLQLLLYHLFLIFLKVVTNIKL